MTAPRLLTAEEERVAEQLAFVLPELVGAWDEGRTDNVELARLIVRLVNGSLDAEREKVRRLRREGQPGLWCPTCGDRLDPIPDEDGAL